jgi:uncharacterized protein YneF (UPF0154 family)
MNYYVVCFVIGLVIGFIGGLLIGRKNVKKVDMLVDKSKDLIDKTKGA